MRLDAVLFDADGVIQLAPASLHLRLSAAMGRPEHEGELCLAEIFAVEEPALTGLATFEDGLAALLEKSLAPCGADTIIDHWCSIDPDPAILSQIAALRARGVFCGLASNQERNRARRMSQILGYATLFDREFYSCDLGHAKPSARYFETVVRMSGLQPARTLFVDDRPGNVEAARACGLHAEVFDLRDSGPNGLARLLDAYFG